MPKILVVDDSKFMRLILRNILGKDAKHNVVGEAENGADAFTKYKELSPDIVTMDIIMPVETGLCAVKKMVEFDKNARIIMVSAMGQEKIVEEAMQLGAKGFVVKPVKPEILLEMIDKVMAS
jgi:two-component system chemotaxis response regulator CheY